MVVRKNNNKEALSDRWLIEAFKTSRDTFYIGELFTRYLHLVYGVCLRWTNDRQLAQDACIGVLENVIRWADKAEVADFKYWLLGLTDNYCQVYMHEKDNIGFLKEEVGDVSMLSFQIQKACPYSMKTLWQLYTKGKLNIDIEISDETIELLNGFYLKDNTLEVVSSRFGISVDQIRPIIRQVVNQLIDALPEDNQHLKPSIRKEKLRSWDTFLKYFTNEIQGKEKNAFERELVADPFEFAAFEGMSLYAGVSIGADLEALQRRIHRRTGYEKTPRRSQLNYKLIFSVLGGGAFLLFVVWFAVNKLTFEEDDEQIPRRIIESTIVSNENDTSAVFESDESDSVESLNQNIDTAPLTQPKKRIVRQKEAERETIAPMPALSLKQIDLDKRSQSPVFVDLGLSGEVVSAENANTVVFAPDNGLETFKKEMAQKLEEKGFTIDTGFVIELKLNSEGKILGVEVLKNDDIALRRAIIESMEEESVWSIVNGRVDQGKEYQQQIVF